jgi:hypothetical protein
MNHTAVPPGTPRGHRVRELVCSYRTLRDADGHVMDVPSVALSNPRIAASTLAPLLAGELVEVFAVACLSTRHRLLTWHVVSRGTRSSTPISIPDVFVPACLTPGTTALVVVHNHPSGVMRTPGICGIGGATLDAGAPVRTWTPHNQSPSRNASNRSLARYRQRPLDGSCTVASARSFIARSASTYRCVVSRLSCPSQSAITDRSTPDCRRCIAVVCRKVCGEIRWAASEGQLALALVTAARRRRSTPERESATPRPLGKSGVSGPGFTRDSHSRKRFAVLFHSGTDRSLRPLPWRRT